MKGWRSIQMAMAKKIHGQNRMEARTENESKFDIKTTYQ